MKKVFLLLLFLAAAAGVTAYVLKERRAAEASDTLAAMQGPKTVKVERDRIDLTVSTTGKVVSNLDVEIKSKASGQIVSLPFDVSDNVTSGDLLAVLDPIDEQRNVAQRQAQLQAANARLSQAEQNLRIAQADVDTGTSSAVAQLESARIKFKETQARLERQQDLFRKQLVSSEELDILRSESGASERALRDAEVRISELQNLPRTVELRKQDVMLNKSEVLRAEIDMQNAAQRLQETKIYAPMDGIITSRPVQTGQIIASGISNVGGGTSLMTLSDLSRIFVNANVDESDIGKVRTGQTAIIRADAYPGKRFTGKVERVAAKGSTNSNVVTFEVKMEVQAAGKELLKPEMTADVDIEAERRDNTLVLPNEAVQFARGEYFVMKKDDANTSGTRVEVKTGITDGVNTEIVSGVEEGDEIILPTGTQSRWARGGPGAGAAAAGGSQNLSRGMQRAAFSLSRPSGGSGGGRR